MSPFPEEPGPPDYGAYLCSPAELRASHERCRALQVPVELERPQKILPKNALAARRRDNSLLLTSAAEVITPQHFTGPQKSHLYILCDSELVALKILAAPEVLAALEKTSIKPGTVFTEESCGTNALALAQQHRRLVAIRGEQHYCKLFKDWWCVAAPVKDPAGSIIGYLDISLHAEKELGLAAEHLQTLVNSIERELYLQGLEQKLQQNDIPVPPSLALPPEIEQELTPRQREILQLLVSGLADEEIAKECFIGVNTVKSHCRNIYRKLGVKEPRKFRRRTRNRPLMPEIPL
jgi:transcriptional regulator of acetoin/glycerol metabolism